MDLLVHHVWPGNLRELRNVLERALVTAKEGVLSREDLDREFPSAASPRPGPDPKRRDSSAEERALIEAALRDTCGNRSRAAMLLGISRITLWKRMRRLGMSNGTRGRG
jgi:transcriptional regulator of acetoin/glycerol metabolism